MSGGGYPTFKNDRGVPEICIGVKEFMCIGETPPQDHPHVYINMGEADTILCPYCATRFRFNPGLTPLDLRARECDRPSPKIDILLQQSPDRWSLVETCPGRVEGGMGRLSKCPGAAEP
jgi:uncharacterized Zn-finger protein